MLRSKMRKLTPIEKKFEASDQEWKSWKWQQQNAIKTTTELIDIFPNLDTYQKDLIMFSENKMRFKITPYMLSLIELDDNQNPQIDDPIFNQYLPCWDTSIDPFLQNMKENWELDSEMITPILQHKYYNRVNFRIQNTCLGYCMYCFEAKRVLDPQQEKKAYNPNLFLASLDYIREHPEVEEVVISGGEPLTLSNDKLDFILSELRKLHNIKFIRIQTRAFVHNPFRLDNEFIELLNKYDVMAMGVHVSHPNEITKEFIEAVERFSNLRNRTLLLGQIPLLKGINDNKRVLIELLMKLYSLKIKPYYLIHSMPYTLGAQKFRTPVRTGVKLMLDIKRKYSNPALPEYIIVHESSKHSVPLDINGSNEFQYLDGEIKFRNWKGEWHYYNDVTE